MTLQRPLKWLKLMGWGYVHIIEVPTHNLQNDFQRLVKEVKM